MIHLTDTDRTRIETAVADAERRTSGEFVALLAESSAGYGAVRIGVPAVAALLLPWLAMALGLGDDPMRLAQAQILLFALLGIALQWESLGLPLAMRLLPERVKRANAARLAHAQFSELGIHRTTERAGVLLFVSLAEHHVEILADRGIAERVDPAAWQAIVDRFTADARAGRIVDGYLAAIEACGALLAEHFPRSPDDRNELPDALQRLR